MNPEIGYTIRKAFPEDGMSIAQVQIKTWQAAYKHIFPAEKLTTMDEGQAALAERWQANIESPDRFPAFFVVEDSTRQVIGFAGADRQPDLNYPYEAELQVIYILPEYHRLGIGRQLMKTVATELHAAGYRSLMLWVLKDNQESRAFYQKLGGKIVGRTEYLRWDQAYPIVAYGWEELKPLINAGSAKKN